MAMPDYSVKGTASDELLQDTLLGITATNKPTSIPSRRKLRATRRVYGTIKRRAPRTKRNAPCPCGSGRKYKQCCMRKRAEE